jgi:hypothetical protein
MYAMSSVKRGSILVLLLSIVVSACGGGSSKTGSGTTLPPPTVASTTTSTTVAAPPTTNAALVAKATAALFQPTDFPAAFKPQPDQGGTCPADPNINCSSLSLETIWHDILTCLAVADTPQAVATSATYLEGLATQARATVEYSTADSASAVEAAVTGPMFQPCVIKAFTADAKRSAPSGATPGAVTVAPLAAPQVGQKVSATRLNVTMNLSALPIKLYQDFVVVFNGGTIVRMFFLNPGSGFPSTLEQSLLQKVVTAAGAS